MRVCSQQDSFNIANLYCHSTAFFGRNLGSIVCGDGLAVGHLRIFWTVSCSTLENAGATGVLPVNQYACPKGWFNIADFYGSYIPLFYCKLDSEISRSRCSSGAGARRMFCLWQWVRSRETQCYLLAGSVTTISCVFKITSCHSNWSTNRGINIAA